MKTLVAHLLRNNLEQIVERSRMHCHARGLHSVMLLESPGKTIRLFVTDEDHVLHQNNPSKVAAEPLSIGFHPHHCNITLQCVEGRVINWSVSAGRVSTQIPITAFRYKSAITAGQGKFERICQTTVQTEMVDCMHPGDSVVLPANELHTIYCPAGQVAAWFVFEGRPDPAYEPICYSNQPLEQMDFSDLYQRTSEADVTRLLRAANLI